MKIYKISPNCCNFGKCIEVTVDGEIKMVSQGFNDAVGFK